MSKVRRPIVNTPVPRSPKTPIGVNPAPIKPKPQGPPIGVNPAPIKPIGVKNPGVLNTPAPKPKSPGVLNTPAKKPVVKNPALLNVVSPKGSKKVD